MAGEPSVVDFNDPRRQYTSGQNQYEPVNARPRASSHVRDNEYRPDQNRSGYAIPTGGGVTSPAPPQSEPLAQVPPELIAQITANVINQLKTTGIDAVTSPAPPRARHSPASSPPPPQWVAPSSSLTDSVTSPPPFSRNVQTSLSSHAQVEAPSVASPQSQPSILQPQPMHPREPLGASFQDNRAATPLGENGEPGRTRPKGPVRLSTSKEETPLEKTWGQLFDEECNPTVRFGQLLRGLAMHIIEDYEPRNSIVITPTKMLRFYDDVKLPTELYPWSSVFDDDRCSISRAYRELGCQHHLIQEHDDERPEIPSLTPVGFQRWVTLLIRAHPDEEYARLQKAVLDMPISNPDAKNERFPKECSRRLFPSVADPRIREQLEKAISKHAKVDLQIHRGGSHAHRPSIVTEMGPPSMTPRPNVHDESTYVSPTHRGKPSISAESIPPLGRGTSIERERAPYANVPAEAIIDDTNPTAPPAQPLERERKPYTAVPGGGKAYDEEGPAKSARAESVSYKINRSNSTATSRPLSAFVMGPRSMDPPPEFGPYHPPPTSSRRPRSPSFSHSSNDFRRPEHDFRRAEYDPRSYASPLPAPSASATDGFDDEARRYARDRPRRPAEDDGREYGDSARTRYERGSYINEEEFKRTDGRGPRGGYEYSAAPYGGSVHR